MLPSTLAHLLAPRRLLPTALVSVVLVGAEAHASHSVLAAGIAALLCLAFFVCAPLSWRALAGPRRRVPSRALGAVIYAGVALALVAALGGLLPAALGLGPTLLHNPQGLVSSAALFVVGGWGLGRDIELELDLTQTRARAAHLAFEAEHARLLAARAHLDPHFLFNTLNAIAEWCREDPLVAEASLVRLSDLLRTVLRGVHTPTWTWHEEITLVRDLLALYAARDPERFASTVDLDDALGERPCPSLLLLPVVENAVKHGPAAGHRGQVAVAVNPAEAGAVVEITNPGTPTCDAMPDGDTSGHGLISLRRRLAAAWPDGSATFALEPWAGGTRARLELPPLAPSPTA